MSLLRTAPSVVDDELSSQDSSSQHLRDFKLAIEFKHLMNHGPGGVYLLPEFDNIRKLHGVIFLRRGVYRDGAFRFVIELSTKYNGKNTHPKVYFAPPIFHPLIHPEVPKIRAILVFDCLSVWLNFPAVLCSIRLEYLIYDLRKL